MERRIYLGDGVWLRNYPPTRRNKVLHWIIDVIEETEQILVKFLFSLMEDPVYG